MKNRLPAVLATFLLITAIFTGGCAVTREAGSGTKEQKLAAAGFVIKPANTAARKKFLASLPAYKLQMVTKGGVVKWAYADPSQNCIYIGGQNEYDIYQTTIEASQMARDDRMAAESNAAMDMGGDDMGLYAPGYM